MWPIIEARAVSIGLISRVAWANLYPPWSAAIRLVAS
jgi:hypothetical protein